MAVHVEIYVLPFFVIIQEENLQISEKLRKKHLTLNKLCSSLFIVLITIINLCERIKNLVSPSDHGERAIKKKYL